MKDLIQVIIGCALIFFIGRWLFYKKKKDGKYEELHSGSFLWEGGKLYLQAAAILAIIGLILTALWR